ncbi:MAG: hypothetical protein GQ537_02635 [Gammaproteobacteria bacterium]|nr:hypothetical protein [Gammaproteobacteria bacterium]
MKGFIKPLVAFVFLWVVALNGMAESRTGAKQDSGRYSAGAGIKLRVVIPEMLLFQSGDTTPGGGTLAFPASVTTPTASGNLHVHSNTESPGSISVQETVTGITYTASSL